LSTSRISFASTETATHCLHSVFLDSESIVAMSTAPTYARVNPPFSEYKSPYAPNIQIHRNFHGIDARLARIYGTTGIAFAGVAGFFALFFFSDLPRVRKDIMQKIPFIGERYVREIPASDNPF